MGESIEIKFGETTVEAELNDSVTAQEVLKVLPLKSGINLWGGEVYFEIPVEAELENGKEIMNAGDISFWPTGSALCIFFGPTPASTDHRPRAVSPVSVIGNLSGEDSIEKIRKIRPDDVVKIELKKKI